MKILVMNGINLGMLGKREPGKYGKASLADISNGLKEWAKTQNDLELDFFSSNYEGEFVEKLYAAVGDYDGIVMNAGAWSHYSIGVRDAIAGSAMPVVEVHITNIYSREEFRHTQVLAPVCVGMITGLGADVYRLGIEGLISYLNKK